MVVRGWFVPSVPLSAPFLRMLQIDPGILRGVSKQGACCQVQVAHVSPKQCVPCQAVQLSHLVTVYADGGICLDILQNQWSPIYDVSAILTSIQVRETTAHLLKQPRHSHCCATPTPTPLPTRRLRGSTLKTGVFESEWCHTVSIHHHHCRREYNRRVKEVVERSWADVD